MAPDTSASPKPPPHHWAKWATIAALAAGAVMTGLVALRPSSPTRWRPAAPQLPAGQRTGPTPAQREGNQPNTRVSGARGAYDKSGCGGPFDSATGHYFDNVIVWAREIR